MPNRRPPTSSSEWPQPYPQSSGSDLYLGTMLGGLQSGQQRVIFLLEMIGHRLEELPEKLAERIPPPAPPAPPRTLPFTGRDWLWIGYGVAGLVLILAGKATLRDVFAGLKLPGL